MLERSAPLVSPATPKVTLRTSLPQEQKTSMKLRKGADVYQQTFIKYPHCGTFHSLAELYHAALLESDPCVESFVPQPYQMRIGSKGYIPDCYVVRGGRRYVRELRSRGEFPEHWGKPLVQFFKRRDIEFEVLPNDDVLKKEILAINWLQIVQMLVSARGFDTAQIEDDVIWSIAKEGSTTLRMVLHLQDEHERFARETALYRLLHRGEVKAELDRHTLNYDTEFTICG